MLSRGPVGGRRLDCQGSITGAGRNARSRGQGQGQEDVVRQIALLRPCHAAELYQGGQGQQKGKQFADHGSAKERRRTISASPAGARIETSEEKMPARCQKWRGVYHI